MFVGARQRSGRRHLARADLMHVDAMQPVDASASS
jgi:hypothetical protein